MPVILPFRAFRASHPTIYIPGEDAPRSIADAGLIQDSEPSLYIYRQRFGLSVRDGIMGVLNRAEATIFRHEEVYPQRVDKCAHALQWPDCDPGSLWLWCDNLGSLLEVTEPPELTATDRFGCTHQIWAIADPTRIRELQSALEGKSLFLADGHHRYAAGWNLATIQVRNEALRSRVPFSIDKLERDARGGVLLPPKSTDFYPKLAAGLIVYRHQNENVTPPVAHRPGVRNPSS